MNVMARPIKNGLDYFPHDVHANNDKKVDKLLFLYGASGYAFYFLHLEYIYQENNFELDVSDAETTQILCRKLQIDENLYQQILNSCLKNDLFDSEVYAENKHLTSHGIKERAKIVLDKRRKAKEKYEKDSKIDKKEVSDAETTQETTSETLQSKVKKRKGKEIINIPYNDIQNIFSEICISFPKLTILNDKRKNLIKGRYISYGIDKIKEVFIIAENSDFLKGKNNQSWKANFDWIMNDTNFAKIADGNYSKKESISKKREVNLE